jgi:general secretion pathway protein F
MKWSQSAIFYEQLRVMLLAGLPIVDSVRHAGQTAGGWYAQQAEGWSAGLGRGQALSELMTTAHCQPFDIALVRAGENSGHLPELCADLAVHYRHAMSLRKMVISRLIYPAFLIHVTLFAAAFPPVFMFGWSAWWLIVGPMSLWCVLLIMMMSWRMTSSATKARLALGRGIGSVVWPLLAANTCSVLRAALSAGMLAPDALELSAGACGNAVLGQRLSGAGRALRQGQLSDVTSALTTCALPVMVIDLCRSGEKAGKLDDTLSQATVAMREQFRFRSEWLARIVCGSIYGAAMVAAAGIVIGFYMGYIGLINGVIDDLG